MYRHVTQFSGEFILKRLITFKEIIGVCAHISNEMKAKLSSDFRSLEVS